LYGLSDIRKLSDNIYLSIIRDVRNLTIEISMISEEKLALIPVVEALIFSSESPLPAARILEVLPDISNSEVAKIVEHLNSLYQSSGRPFFIKNIANGYQMFTLPEFFIYIERLNQNRLKSRLTQKSLETLAIIAYKQPITKHDVEEIRGVNSDGVIKNLLSRNLISITGRAQAPGSPFIYQTTKKFLDYFGLSSLSDLPKIKEIDELIDVDEDSTPYHEILLKEIAPDELGIQAYRNGDNGDSPKSEKHEGE
jgi:segregation and condensation protein B